MGGNDRAQLERLCRYLGRPPIAQERLDRLGDGRLRYSFKKAWKDGTRAVVLDPLDLIARIVAMIPAPGFHMVRYHGVLSSHSSLRRLVVPTPPAPVVNPLLPEPSSLVASWSFRSGQAPAPPCHQSAAERVLPFRSRVLGQ